MSDPPSVSAVAAPFACPHLGTAVEGAGRRPATALPGALNRCFAFGDGVDLSTDQQRLVCLTERHPACRRFVLSSSGSAPASGIPERPLLTRPAVLAALVVLGIAFMVAVGFLLGGAGELAVGTAPGI